MCAQMIPCKALATNPRYVSFNQVSLRAREEEKISEFRLSGSTSEFGGEFSTWFSLYFCLRRSRRHTNRGKQISYRCNSSEWQRERDDDFSQVQRDGSTVDERREETFGPEEKITNKSWKKGKNWYILINNRNLSSLQVSSEWFKETRTENINL